MTLGASECGPRATGSCPRCSAELLTTEYGELCAPCLFHAGMGARSPERVGPYELLHALDAGGTGTVHIARHVEQEGLVALKRARPEILDSQEAIAAFRNGLRIQRALRGLPNIVGTDDLGTDEGGRPYAVMPLLDGGTLEDGENLKRYAEPAEVLALMITVTRAVQLAHERGVLHCDLKPSNVLFSADGTPFVGDFGLARIVGRSDLARGAAFAGGTPGWMSPEQVLQDELTTASDVFSLGVMLYWLLTREMPFGHGEDSMRRVVHDAPAPLRSRYTGRWRWELDQICARALHRRPEQRYRSAAELADDLARVRDGVPIQVERRRPFRRAFKWIRRHKIAALASMELVLLLLYLPLMPLSVFRELKGAIRAQIEFSASAQAGAVMNELRAGARRLEQLALDPEIQRLVDHPDPYVPPPALAAGAGAFDGLSVFSAQGRLRARFPEPEARHPTLDFSFRDYFVGAQRIARAGRRGVYVARPYYSTGDEQPMLGLSTPLYDGDTYVGALIGRTRARATFGAVQMNCGGSGTCMTALLGPRDRDGEGQPMPTTLYVVAAPGLSEGQALMVPEPLAKTICTRVNCSPRPSNQFDQPVHARPVVLDDYEDPISHVRSMAALAPVGGTGLIVVVATPDNALDAITERMTDRVKTFLWVPVLAGLLLLLAVIAGPALLQWLREHGLLRK